MNAESYRKLSKQDKTEIYYYYTQRVYKLCELTKLYGCEFGAVIKAIKER